MLNDWGAAASLDSVLLEAATFLRRAVQHEGWGGPSRDVCDAQLESWAQELCVLAAATSAAGQLP